MIYLDNAATTRPDDASVQEAMRFLKDDFFNPSALYREGFAAGKEIEAARAAVLQCVADAEKYELIFTSCGSESDNQALFSAGRRGNVVITEGEHAAVQNAAAELARRGIEVRRAKLNANGSVNVDSLLDLVDDNTALVSVIHVNNETGAINDVNGIAEEVKKIKSAVVFHSDGVQAFGKIPYRIGANIDLYSISAHKIGGIRGIAALIKRKQCVLHPLIWGGGQEKNRRSGTENTFGIKQFERVALRKYARLNENWEHVNRLAAYAVENLDSNLFQVLSAGATSPYILSVSAVGLRGEVLLHMLNDRGVLVGTGSACSSKSRLSRVILATGVEERIADGVLRLSFCAETTEQELAQAVEIINQSARELREKTR